jgi:beta-1,4-mannosyl-glycoprotein beta-1,4-N-acetylglucosaminyltransferase
VIYDVVLFNDELELLSLRAATLSPIESLVHVIVEGDRYFTGEPRQSQWTGEVKESLQGFYSDERFAHLLVEMPKNPPDRWAMERFQRNAMAQMRDVCELQPTDWLVFSDGDEIPRPSSLEMLYDFAALFRGYPPPVVFRQRMYYYFLNVMLNDPLWAGPIAVQQKVFEGEHYSVQGLRDDRAKLPLMLNGGWHFSFMGGLDRVHQKIRQFSHVEHDTEETHDGLAERFAKLIDPFAREGHHLTQVPIDHTFPEMVRKNQQHYREDGWIR